MVKAIMIGRENCIAADGKDDTHGVKKILELEPDDLLAMLEGFHVDKEGEQYYKDTENEDAKGRRQKFERAAKKAVADARKTKRVLKPAKPPPYLRPACKNKS